MRITTNMTAANAIYNLQKAETTLNNLTTSTITQQNVNQPSDNPGATNTLLNVNDTLNALNQYSTNITNATTTLNMTSNALTGMSDSITQAQQLVASMTNGSDDPSIRQSAYDQLAAIKQQIIDYGNTQSGNTYVFGGTTTSTAPFSVDNTTTPPTNNYNGDSTQSQVEITTGSYQTVNVTGDRVLMGTGSNPSYGSTNILQTLDNLMSAVGNSTNPSNTTLIKQYSNDLDAGATQINNAQVDVAARLSRLSTISTMNTNNQNTLQGVIGNIQNVDLATVGTELNQQQTAYQAALSATAQISKMSLLNYL